jgi:hypothetical protein
MDQIRSHTPSLREGFVFPSLGSFGNMSVKKEGGNEAKNVKKEVLK